MEVSSLDSSANSMTFFRLNGIALDILTVDPNHQRRGAGRMLVRWGTAIADQMGVEARWSCHSEFHRLMYKPSRLLLNRPSMDLDCIYQKVSSSNPIGKFHCRRSGWTGNIKNSTGWSDQRNRQVKRANGADTEWIGRHFTCNDAMTWRLKTCYYENSKCDASYHSQF